MADKSEVGQTTRSHKRRTGLLAPGNLAMGTAVLPLADNLVQVLFGAGNRVGYLRDVCESVNASKVNIVDCALGTVLENWGGMMLLEATPEQSEQVKANLDKYTAPTDPPPPFVPGGRWLVFFRGPNEPGLLYKVTNVLASKEWQLNIYRFRSLIRGDDAAFYLEVEWERDAQIPPPSELARALREYGDAECREMRRDDDPLLPWLLEQEPDSQSSEQDEGIGDGKLPWLVDQPQETLR